MFIQDHATGERLFISDSVNEMLGNVDAMLQDGIDTAVFFARQLEYIKSSTYDVKYANLKFRELFPVSNAAGPGAKTITYWTYDQAGMAEIISSGYAKDLPRADIGGKETTINVRELGISFGWTMGEIRSAARIPGMSIDAKKAQAAVRGNEQKLNSIAWYGDDDAGLLGVFNNPNLTIGNVINGAGGQPEWSTKTPDEILFDLNSIVNDINTDTLLVEAANTLLLPPVQHALIRTTPRSPNSDTTILMYFVMNNDFISGPESVISVNELTGAGTAGADVMIAYDRSPASLEMEIPMELTFHAEQRDGLEVLVPAECSVGGLNIYYPLSFSIREGI